MLAVDGAVDRITEEIVANLETSKVLVVWIMDASISLKADRQEAAARLERIYRELDELGATTQDALSSAVIGFGEQAQELAPPGSTTDEIISAIRSVPTDESGVENVFSTIISCVVRYQRQRLAEHRRELFVIWTDESGNDYSRLEEAVTFCRNNVIPVYVVGPSAMLGKQRGTIAYQHTNGKTYNLPVDRGPDSVRDERLHLPYWFEGDQYESLRGADPLRADAAGQRDGRRLLHYGSQGGPIAFCAGRDVALYAGIRIAGHVYARGCVQSASTAPCFRRSTLRSGTS